MLVYPYKPTEHKAMMSDRVIGARIQNLCNNTMCLLMPCPDVLSPTSKPSHSRTRPADPGQGTINRTVPT
ncbi:hypothetical protein GDO86_006824 [Hymenochirus boettgeri]|uniref:Uncharacterized protein n=1 Tax=Hymenochirus boettgeri TaxID=247094 RepID=A0A8T2J7P2_9PIPI|nr:hypothetical protein GDO86_006824 [Hymenochirus boettgeri]